MNHNVGSEGIEVMKLGIMLSALSVILVYVVFNVSLGNQMQRAVYDVVSQGEVSSANAPLSEIAGEKVRLPSAAVYSLLMYNGRNIGTIRCFVCEPVLGLERNINEDFCIVNHLKGKVDVSTNYNIYTGLYDITVGNTGEGEDE